MSIARDIHHMLPSDGFRFWSKVDIQSHGCWNWLGSRHRNHYGQFSLGTTKMDAHRFAWWLAFQIDPAGYQVCHSCDNPSCVNPSHLWLGTHLMNMRDAQVKNRNQYGARHWNARLTLADVERIRELRSSGLTQREIATQFHIGQMQVSRIMRGERWKIKENS
jgi:DNA-binding CsgD family transcriptional regulator